MIVKIILFLLIVRAVSCSHSINESQYLKVQNLHWFLQDFSTDKPVLKSFQDRDSYGHKDEKGRIVIPPIFFEQITGAFSLASTASSSRRRV